MLNRQIRWILAIVSIGFIASVASYELVLSNTCPVRQLDIASDVKKYDQTKDPLLCDALNSKISQFNDACKTSVEELDCG
ncbi:MAG TPA: hypothetical protein VFJ23_02930 [Candidatus Nitrosotalea sp.]|nr:hypothetical protein [Candidatus Nitrosotalea sp.]